MEIKASAKYLRASPRKLRMLAGGLRGLSARKALEKLAFYPQRGSELISKVVKQAIGNATANFKLAEDSLFIKKIEVGEGPSFKRMDKSHGARFDRGTIKKRTAHLFLVLEAKEEKNGSQLLPQKVKKAKVIKSSEKPVSEEGKSSFSASRRIRRTRGTKS